VNQVQYKVARGVLRMPRKTPTVGTPTRAFNNSADYIKQGEVVPEGMLSPEEIASLLSGGIIEELTVAPGQSAAVPVKSRGKWGVDPVTLVGKNLEELLIVVMQIDETFDVNELKTEADAVRHLTQHWDPAFREEIARSTDRSRPEQMKMKSSSDNRTASGVKDAGDRPLSGAAEKALANAKARAQATPEADDLGTSPS